MLTPIREALTLPPPDYIDDSYPLIEGPLGLKLWAALLGTVAIPRGDKPRLSPGPTATALRFLHRPTRMYPNQWRMVYLRDLRGEIHEVVDRLRGSARLERALELIKELEC